MANGTWKRTTSASRRAERQIRFVHVSKWPGQPVGETFVQKNPKKPSKRAIRNAVRRGHDWAGEYGVRPDRTPAARKALARLRRKPVTVELATI